MIRSLLHGMATCIFCAGLPHGAHAELALVRNHQAEAVIWLPAESGEAVRLAARELQVYLRKISGGELPVVAEKPEQESYITFRVIPDATGDLFAQDTFTIGTDERAVTISGHSEIAVLYGAYQLLNDLGVRWFSPGEIGENVPESPDIAVKAGSKTHRPSFRTRMIDYNGTDDWHFGRENQERQHRDYDLWLLRNRLQFQRMIHNRGKHHHYDFGWSREFSHHNLRNAALGRDWKENAGIATERLALVTKDKVTERTVKDAQVCLTHPENIATAIRSAATHFREFPERATYPLSLDDHYGFCECEGCVDANGGISPANDPNRVVWKFMNAVANGLHGEMPGKRIAFYATYQMMTHPPHDVQAEPNVVAVTCHVSSQARAIADPEEPRNAAFLNHIRLVGTSGAERGAYDYFLFPGNPQPLKLLEDIQLYHDLGYVWYAAEWMGRDEQRHIVAWVLAQLAWNIGQDPRALLETFCNEYYGAAGPEVIRWLDLIESRVHAMKRITFGHLGLTSLMLTEAVVEEGKSLLAEAASKVSGREAERVRRLALTFESWHRAAEVDRLYKEALVQRSEAGKQKVRDAIASFGQFWRENRLAEICSPRLLDHYVNEYSKKVLKIQPKVRPSARADFIGTDRPGVIDALFSNAGADVPTLLRESEENGFPQKIENISLLPERWKFRMDPEDADVSNPGGGGGGPPPWSKPEFDDSEWVEISTFNSFDAQGFSGYAGVFWYRLSFKAPAFPRGKRVWLRIGALDDDGAVYLNGRLVGERENIRVDDWKNSFAFDVTDSIRPGRKNVVAIRGLNAFGAGGLWKPVGLYTRDNLAF